MKQQKKKYLGKDMEKWKGYKLNWMTNQFFFVMSFFLSINNSKNIKNGTNIHSNQTK